MRRLSSVLVVASASLAFTSCVIRARTLEVRELPKQSYTAQVRTPLKVHMVDGSVILFRNGAIVTADSVKGMGYRYDIALVSTPSTKGVSLDSVAGLESFTRGDNAGKTLALSVPATMIGIPATMALLAALFGSCPTYYTSDATGHATVLEAEGFSYSIAPIFEGRDVDPIRARPAIDGSLNIEVRNEALETHYLNHFELMAVDHAPGERALPDHRGQPVIVGKSRVALRARDRAGRDVRRALAVADKTVFTTAESRLASVSAGDFEDFIELEFAPTGADSAALVLNLRNSLLSTVMLYDVMLASAGAQAIDWIGDDLQKIGPATAVAKWYASHMGLRVAVADGPAWRDIARVPDVGPIAMKEMVIMVPMRRDSTVRVRISFPADSWRFDAVSLASVTRPKSVQIYPVAQVVLASDQAAGVRSALAAPDDDYVTSIPGQRFTLRFQLPPAHAGPTRSLMIASQGYYTEWVRRDWVRREGTGRFTPSDDALLEAMAIWRSTKKQFEKQFYTTAVPVR